MKVLLIEAIDTARGQGVETRYPPLSLAYLAANLPKKINPEYLILRGGVATAKYVRGFEPNVIGITSVTQNFDIAIKVVEALKSASNAPIVMGGHHITHHPDSLPDGCVGVMGEGEQTFNQLLELINRKTFTIDEWEKIKGLVWRNEGVLLISHIKEGELLCNSRSEAIDNLDDLKSPIRFPGQLLDGNGAHMLTSRGCPFDCVFCSSCNFWDKTRFHSPKRVIAEIKSLMRDHGASRINIYDDLFAFNKKRLKEIRDLMHADTFFHKNPFSISCLARASIVDRELVKILKDLNVHNVAMGLESGNDKVLKYLKGPKASVKSNLKAIKMLDSAGINVVASFVYGSPDETFEQAMDSVKMASDERIKIGEAYLIVPYPGTPLWNQWTAGTGGEPKEFEWRRFNSDFNQVKEDAIIVSNKMGYEELWEIKEAFDKVWSEKK